MEDIFWGALSCWEEEVRCSGLDPTPPWRVLPARHKKACDSSAFLENQTHSRKRNRPPRVGWAHPRKSPAPKAPWPTRTCLCTSPKREFQPWLLWQGLQSIPSECTVSSPGDSFPHHCSNGASPILGSLQLCPRPHNTAWPHPQNVRPL